MNDKENLEVIPQHELHKTFIAMLFAFVVSVVAQQIAEILIVATNNWKVSDSPVGIYEKASSSFWLLMTAASHSLLALLMVSISWVMWSRSQAKSHRADLQTVFSIKFLIMMMEVFLVILYFAIAKSIEADFSAYQKNPSINTFVVDPSAKPEASQIRWVFFIFLLWDVLVDVVQSPRDNPEVGLANRASAKVQGFLVYCSVSLICFLGAWVVSSIAVEKGAPYQAILGDVALIALLFFFSLSKSLEYYLINIFPKEGSRKNTTRKEPTQVELLLLFFFVVLYIVCIWTMVKPS